MLRLIRKVSPKTGVYECTACDNTDNKLLSRVYNILEVEIGKATCRNCRFIESARSKGLCTVQDIWNDAVLNEMKWDRHDYKSIMTGSYIAVTNNDDIDAGVSVGTVYGGGVLRGILHKVKGVNAGSVSVTQPLGFVVKCSNCGLLSLCKSKRELDNFSCKACACLIKKREREAVRAAEKSKQRVMNKISDSAEKAFIKAGHVLTDVKEGSTLDKRMKKFQEKNAGYSVLDIKANTSEGSVLTACCSECGTIYPYAISRCDSSIGECEFCKMRKPWELGLMKRSHIGEVHNMLVITGQDGLTCTVRCRMCQKEKSGLDLYGVLKNKYVCDCDYVERAVEDEFLMCENCGEQLKGIKTSDIVCGRVAKCRCQKCGQGVDMNAIGAVLAGNDYKATLLEKVKMAGGIFKGRFAFDGVQENGLLREKDPLYISNTDNLPSYRCYCTLHSKSMILSEKEIANYNHQSCYDERQRVVADINVDELKI